MKNPLTHAHLSDNIVQLLLRKSLMRNISNSEVTTWLSCRRQYKYAFDEAYGLEPKVMGKPLYNGGIGHSAFQRYIEARLDNKSHDDSMVVARTVFTEALREEPDRLADIMKVQMIFDRYHAYHQGWPNWILHEPEQRFELQLTDTIKMVIRYDAKVTERNTGKTLIVDWKYHYDFMGPDSHALSPQLPKYIFVMNANGIKIDGGLMEELRTRDLGKEKAADPKATWKRTPYFPLISKQKNMIRQHIAASLEIERWRALPREEREFEALPVLNDYGPCKRGCSFQDLCISENDGKDITVDIQVGYKQNTYGYNPVEEFKERL
jgi:hypothetical protein